MAPLVAFTEVIGGLLLIVGLLDALAGAALAADMLVAVAGRIRDAAQVATRCRCSASTRSRTSSCRASSR